MIQYRLYFFREYIFKCRSVGIHSLVARFAFAFVSCFCCDQENGIAFAFAFWSKLRLEMHLWSGESWTTRTSRLVCLPSRFGLFSYQQNSSIFRQSPSQRATHFAPRGAWKQGKEQNSELRENKHPVGKIAPPSLMRMPANYTRSQLEAPL